MSETPDDAGQLSDEPVEFVVAESEAGQRRDVLLTIHFHDYSRGLLRKIITARGVKVDGRGGKPAHRVRAGPMGRRARDQNPSPPRK